MTSFPEPPSEIKAMMKRYMAVAALAAFPMVAQAETPNVTPGEWEFVSVTSVSGDMQIPDQTETERQCITQEELEGADFGFIEEEEGCELLNQDMSADGLSYSMVCRAWIVCGKRRRPPRAPAGACGRQGRSGSLTSTGTRPKASRAMFLEP